MEIIFRKQYLKDLRKIPKPVFLAADTVVTKLRDAENLQTSVVDYKKMKGGKKGEDYYRIRIGDYRIGVELIMPSIIIITVYIGEKCRSIFHQKNKRIVRIDLDFEWSSIIGL